MSVTTSVDKAALNITRSKAHPNCVVCSAPNPHGLSLDFAVTEDGSVRAPFDCPEKFEGYPGLLHGGIVAAALDGAMTNSIFARGQAALTGELSVRYRYPVRVKEEAVVHAWIERSSSRFYLARAELLQQGEVKATATGKFMLRLSEETER